MKAKLDYLSHENDSLEFEVQGFISELNDNKRYIKEREKEIDMLKEQLEKGTARV